jgi:hypothetical protein
MNTSWQVWAVYAASRWRHHTTDWSILENTMLSDHAQTQHADLAQQYKAHYIMERRKWRRCMAQSALFLHQGACLCAGVLEGTPAFSRPAGHCQSVTVTCPCQHSDADRAESSRRQSRTSRWRHTLFCPFPALRSTADCPSPRPTSAATGEHRPPDHTVHAVPVWRC